MSAVSYLRDSLVNFVTGLGTGKDPRVSTHYHYSWIDRNVLEKMYRTDWLARKIVDAPAEDATREWRTWLTEKDSAAKIEKLEKALQIQRKTREALIRARLYGGAAMVLGVDQGLPHEELDLDSIDKDSLRFVVVLNRYELNAGPRIYNVDSPYYTRPEWYMVATPMFGFEGESGGAYPANNNSTVRGSVPVYPYGQSPPNRSYTRGQEVNRLESNASPGMIVIHPSRVVEFSGNELPDWRLAPMGGGWGDPVLQTCEDALKDFGISIAGLAAMINDMKMDVVKVPELSRKLATAETSMKLLNRFTMANQAKSAINTLLLDKEEEWDRITTSFSSTPQLIETIMQVACAAGGIPVSRAMGSAPSKGLNHAGGSGGEVDIRNYYDAVGADQQTKYRPRMLPLDVCLACSALGPAGKDVDYLWNPLYRPTAQEEAAVAFQKAQATQIYVGTGLISEDVLRDGVVNQLIEDDVYPGLQDAIDANGGAAPDVEEPPPEEPPPTPPPGFLPKGQFEPNPFKLMEAQRKGNAPGKTPPQNSKAAQTDAAAAEFLSFMDYDENEPRDEMGKWTSAGGGGIQTGTLKEKAVEHLLAGGQSGVTAESLAQHVYGKPHAEAGGALSGVIKGISIAAPKAGYDFAKKYGSGANAVYALTKKEGGSLSPAAKETLAKIAPASSFAADPALPPGHQFQQSTSGFWHVINKNMDSVGFGKTKAEAVSAMGKDLLTNGAPAASPAYAAIPGISPSKLASVDDWKKIGPQKGSNPGGLYQAPTGDQYYVKTPPSEDYARNEVLTGKLYALAGAKVPSTGLVSMGGKVAVASKMIPGSLKTLGELEALPLKSVYNNAVNEAKQDFAADAWLGNRDVVGLSKDNIVRTAMTNYRVDHGGGLNYRAQGQTKEFGPNADEFHSLRDPGINKQAADVFGNMTDEELKASIAKVTSVSPAQISEAVASVYPKGTPKYDQLTNTLVSRQWYLFQEAQKLGGAPPPEPVLANFAHEPTRADERLYQTQQMEEEQGVDGPSLPSGYEYEAGASAADFPYNVIHSATGEYVGVGATQKEAFAHALATHKEFSAAASPALTIPLAPKWSETNLPPGWVAKPSSSNPNALSFYEGSTYQGKIMPQGSEWSVPLVGSGKFSSKDEAIHAFVSSKYDPAAAAKKTEAAAKAQAAQKMTAAQKAAAAQDKIKQLAAMSYTPEEAVKKVTGWGDSNMASAGAKAKQSGFNITSAEAAAIQSYTDGSYGGINKALRKNELTEAEFLYAQTLKSGLKKIGPYVGTVKRGTDLSPEQLAQYKVGTIKFEPGFTSTSISSPWSGNAQFTIETQHGIHIKALSFHPGENEVLLPTHLPLKVIAHDVVGGTHHIHMVEVAHSAGSLADARRD